MILYSARQLVQQLRGFGVDVPAFEEIATLDARPFAPPLPADPIDGRDIVDVMAAGELTPALYERYLQREAVLEHRVTEAMISNAREGRRAYALDLLKRDGAQITEQLMAYRRRSRKDNDDAGKVLKRHDVTNADVALKRSDTASAWATQASTYDDEQRVVSLINTLIAEGIVPAPAPEPAGIMARLDKRLAGALKGQR
jgi:hypothetical protein